MPLGEDLALQGLDVIDEAGVRAGEVLVLQAQARDLALQGGLGRGLGQERDQRADDCGHAQCSLSSGLNSATFPAAALAAMRASSIRLIALGGSMLATIAPVLPSPNSSIMNCMSAAWISRAASMAAFCCSALNCLQASSPFMGRSPQWRPRTAAEPARP